MFGWIAQWYVNVPAVANVNVNDAPGAIALDSHADESELLVCTIASPLVQVTLVPRAIVSGLGLKAVVDRPEAPATIETWFVLAGAVGLAGVGLAGVAFELPFPPHPIAAPTTRHRIVNRRFALV